MHSDKRNSLRIVVVLIYLSVIHILGCIDSAADSDSVVEMDDDGNAYSFPASIEFSQRIWHRDRKSPPQRQGVAYHYSAENKRERLRLFQGKPEFGIQRLFQIETRKDEISPWVVNGPVRILDKYGIVTVSTYVDGRDHGPENTFYVDGVIRSKGFSIDNVWTGEFHAFYPNGKPWWSAEFEDGWRKTGKDVLYDSDGNELKEATREDVNEAVEQWKNIKLEVTKQL